MRDLIITLFIVGAMPFCFRRPFVGMLMFALLAYMRLQDLAWGFARFQRWSMFVAVLSLAGYIAARYRTYPPKDLRVYLMFGLIIHVGIGQFFIVGDAPLDLKQYVEFVKIVFIAIFTTAVVKTQSHVRIMVWVIAMALSFHGTKNGIAAFIKMGNLYIDHGPGGLIKDNNDFALAVAMIIPFVFYLSKSETNPILVKILKIMVPLCALTVISTRSRGGTLSLALMACVLIWRSRNRFMGFAVGAISVVAVVALAPSEYKERISTIKSYEEDGSAMGRLRAWAVAIRMIQAHPISGVGFNRFAINHVDFQPNPTEAERSGQKKALVAHNSYFQIWAEAGTPAFVMYMMLIWLTFWDVWRVRKRAKKLYHDSWILSYCSMFEASLATFVLGSVFLNRAAFDLVYHVFALVVSFGIVARKQMDKDEKAAQAIRSGKGPIDGSRGGDVGIMAPTERPKFRRVVLES